MWSGIFGVGHFPVAIPAKFQGETLRLQATASVRYPEGKGEMLRFRNGVPVPHNERLPSLSVLGSLVWFVLLPWFVLFRRAGAGPTLNLVLPSGVAEPFRKALYRIRTLAGRWAMAIAWPATVQSIDFAEERAGNGLDRRWRSTTRPVRRRTMASSTAMELQPAATMLQYNSAVGVK